MTENSDPLHHIRENRSDVELLADQEREDSLAAWARIMIALADDDEPAESDLERTGLPTKGEW